MTQLGEGRGAVHGAGAPVGGEILAGRYQLEQHINTDSAGRQIWRGVDVILRRPVALVMRYPGGPAATQMLQSAVEASRIVHPNLIGVYDAIDEEVRAYVVREWVDGASLREHLAVGLFDAERAIAVAHAVSAAVTGLHATGMTHGNVHPGTVLIGLDGRVVLADARADGAAPPEEDIRAIGGLQYFALTGYWPHAEVAGPQTLPDAMRDPGGGLASPRQVRAGVPDFLDNLTMDLLDRRLAVPAAEVLAGEYARLDAEPAESGYYPEAAPDQRSPEPLPEPVSAGPLRMRAEPAAPPRPSGRKIAVGLAGLLVIGVVGLLVGLNLLTGSSSPPEEPQAGDPGATAPPDGATTDPEVGPVTLTADQVRVVDPEGDGAEREGVENVVDDDLSTGWRTATYYDGFTVVKSGIGILVDLGEEMHVASVRVEVDAAGATAELRTGDGDPGPTAEGDEALVDSYTPVGSQIADAGTTMVFDGFEPDGTYQYLLVWFTELPSSGEGDRLEVQQVDVEGY